MMFNNLKHKLHVKLLIVTALATGAMMVYGFTLMEQGVDAYRKSN